jgi:guanylate cyclase
VLSVAAMAVFAATRDYGSFRDIELALILFLPLALHVILGGFVPSSAVVLWSLIAPLGALVYADVRAAYRWFALYLVALVVALVLEGSFVPDARLTPDATAALFVLNLAGVSTIGFLVLSQYVRQLGAERARSEGLLLNVLPKPIADRLKRATGRIADSYDAATILFADVVGSTPLTTQLTPSEMVGLLDEYVARFDALAERHGVEKIRTIGDNWMGVSGVPRPRPDHARCAALMALDMIAFCSERAGSRALEFRIGLSSGPVVGGVIGRSKFVFDIWGDAVNTAARMESTGTPGRIQISADTYELVKDEFVCEPRGTIAVKGKGEMRTWLLVGRASVAQVT